MSAPAEGLEATFDRWSKSFERDVEVFREKLRALEKSVAPGALIVGARREGHLLHITVIPAVKQAKKTEANQAVPWADPL